MMSPLTQHRGAYYLLLATCYLLLTTYYRCHLQQLLGVEEASAQVLQLHLIRVRVRVGVRVGVRSGVRVGFKVGVRVGFKVGVRVGVARGSLSLTGSAQVLQVHRELDKIGGAEQLALVDLEDGRAHADEAHRPVHNEHIPHAQ